MIPPDEDRAFRVLTGEAEQNGNGNGTAADLQWEPLLNRELPPFPVDALPARVAAMVRATAEHTQTPPDLAAFSALGVLSTAALGTVVDCGSWQEQAALYLLVVMPSGDRKSTVLRMIVAPLREIERKRQDTAAPEVREQRRRRDVLETRKKKLTTQAAAKDGNDRFEAENELREVDEELAGIGEPELPRLLMDDATPEGLATALWRHGSIGVLEAESALLDNLLGRYSEGNPNLHLVCKAYQGESATIDRKSHDFRRLDCPRLATLFVVQPHVLEKLINHETARQQGFTARFAYIRPASRLGQRKIGTEPVPLAVSEAWKHVVQRVAESKEATLRLSCGASALLTELQEQLEPRLGQGGDLAPIAEWAGRHHGRVARIAGLLHLCEHSREEPISEVTMAAAVRIGDYLLAHGIDALTGPDLLVRKTREWLEKHRKPTVTQRDLERGPLNGRGRAAAAAELADRLVTLGVFQSMRAAAGNKGPVWAVHPDLTSPIVRTVSTVSTPTASENGTTVSTVSTSAPKRNENEHEHRTACRSPDGHRGAGRWRLDSGDYWMCDECHSPPQRRVGIVHEHKRGAA
jgi:hypothetical protein